MLVKFRLTRLALFAVCTCLAGRADAQQCEPAPPSDLLHEIEEHFPSARKWFGMVSDLAWERDRTGGLTPRFEGMRSRFVLARDASGQRLGARLPSLASGAHEVWIDGAPGLSVRVEELGVPAVPGELLRGVVVYRGAIAGGDLLYKLTPTHVDEYLYLRDPPTGLRREFEFDVGRGVARLREGGRIIEVIGKDGTAHLRLNAPVARAADGTRRTGTVYLEGRALIEEIDLRGLSAPILIDPDWTTTGSMTVSHFADFGWRRPDNRVMAVAGCTLAACPIGLAPSACSQVLLSTDLWDPKSGSWTFGPELATARYSFAAVTLASGDLLVAGGCVASGCAGTTALAERYSIAQGSFVPAGSLPRPLANTGAALLPGGDVLLPGGCDQKRCFPDVARYQAAADRWVPEASLSGPRGYATVTALGDGTVLVIGGCADPACANVLGGAERFDPKSDTWQDAGSMSTPRAGHTATLNDDGTVLVAGGCSEKECGPATLGTAELWQADPQSGGRFTAGPPLREPRHHHTATRLANGEILLAGGTDGTDVTRAASEIYLPQSRRFDEGPRMMMSRAYHIAVGLDSGEVLVGGGCNPATCIPWSELFSPVGLPLDAPDAGMVDGGGPADLGPAPRPDWGAPFVVRGGPHPKLFRTGATSCATDDAQDLPCPIAGWPGQDGQYQPNTRPYVPRSTEEVEDLVTGLVWQRHDDGQPFDQAGAVARCAAFQSPGAPAGQWRLPSVVELATTVQYGMNGPSTDQAFDHAQPTSYWTASPVVGSKMLGWTVDYDAGEVMPVLKDRAVAVRCVRGQLKSANPGSDQLRLAGPLTAGDATVLDTANQVEWQRRDDGVRRSWRESLAYCANLALNDHHDWHLPNVYELLSLVEFGMRGLNTPAKIDPLFQDPRPDLYWTSTFNEGQPTTAWSVTFNLGIVDGVSVGGGGFARCVRHVQPAPTVAGCSCQIPGSRAGDRSGGLPGVATALMVFALAGLAMARRR